MKKITYIFIILLISCSSGADEAEIQAQIDEAVNEALKETTTTTTTTTTTIPPITTTTTTVDSTCVDYAVGLLSMWDDLYTELTNIALVFEELSFGTITYAAGANEFFAINLRWESLTNEADALTPDTKNKRFHSKLIQSFDYISESLELSIKGLDEVDPDLIERAVSLLDIAYTSLDEAIGLIPDGTIYGMKDAC